MSLLYLFPLLYLPTVVLAQSITSAYTQTWSPSNGSVFTLDIFHTAELFGRIAPISLNGSVPGSECNNVETISNVAICPSNNGYSVGGLPRLKSYVDTARAAYQNNPTWSINAAKPLLIDGGDFFFSSPVYNALHAVPYYPQLMGQLGVDVMGVGQFDLIENVQQTGQYWNQIAKQIPIVASNIHSANDEFLGTRRPNATYNSASTSQYDWYHILNLPINGNPNTTVPVGVVGCMYEEANTRANLGSNILVDSQPEASIRLAIQLLQHNYPNVSIIIMISSCTKSMNEELARNIIEIDVIIETNSQLYSNTETAGVVSQYPKVISNNVGSPCLLVASGINGARVGHLAVQFGRDGQALSWRGDSILLTPSIPADPTMASFVGSLLHQTDALESQVIGKVSHDIEAIGCRTGECPAGDFTGDALLYACQDCAVSVQNGGGFDGTSLYLMARGGNITVKDLYTIVRFQNVMSTVFLPGSAILTALQTGLNKNSTLQVSGLRYAFNPDQSIPIEQRIVYVEIWSSFAKAYVPLGLSTLYKVATSDFIALGGGGHTEFLNFGQQLQRYGPLLRQVYTTYIQSHSPVNTTTSETSAICNSVTYVLGVQQGQTIWPNPACRIIRVSGSQDLSKKCVTNPSITLGQEVYPGMIAGQTIINSTMAACSGLGLCSQQICACGVASEGMYAGLVMSRGADCSDVRREYKFSEAGTIIFYILSALVILLSVMTSIFYAVYRGHRVVRASSPWFMQISCIGAALAALSVIISVSSPTDSTCAAQYWTLAIGFGLTFGSLFAKTYRLYRIFNQREMKVISITNWNVLLVVIGVVAIEMMLLILFQVISPLRVTGRLMDDEQTWSYTLSCSSQNGGSFGIVLVVFNCFILLVGTYLAWELRNIDSTFNETKHLGMAIYNTTMVSVIVLPLVYVFRDTYPSFVTAFRSIFILYCATFVLLIVTVPKYFSIRASQEDSHDNNSTHTHTHNTHRESNNSKRISSNAFPRIRTGDVPTRVQLMAEFMSTLPNGKKLNRLMSYAQNVDIYLNEIRYLIATLQEDDKGESSKREKEELPSGTMSASGSSHELREVRLNGLHAHGTTPSSGGVRASSSISEMNKTMMRGSMSMDPTLATPASRVGIRPEPIRLEPLDGTSPPRHNISSSPRNNMSPRLGLVTRQGSTNNIPTPSSPPGSSGVSPRIGQPGRAKNRL